MVYNIMSDKIAIHVIVGLAVGIGFVILFAVIFVPTQTLTTGRDHIDVTIEGLKNVYKVGEVIDPVIKLRGYGNPCFSPNLAVRDAKTLEVVWASRTALTTCEIQTQEINIDFHPEDIGTTQIIINETGSYKMAVSAPGKTVMRTFDVIER